MPIDLTLESDSMLGDIEEVFAASPSDLTTVGGLWFAPYGSALPEDIDEPFEELKLAGQTDSPWKNFGFVADDGVQIKVDSTTRPIEVWGGDEIGALRDKFALTYSCKLYQVLSPAVNAAIWGTNAVSTQAPTSTAGNRMKLLITNKLPKKLSLVVDSVFEDKAIRQVISTAQLSDLGNITLVHNAPMALEPSFKSFKGRDGVHVTQYSDDGRVTI